MVQELKDTCWRCLQSELHSSTKVAQQEIVEQFIHILPPQGRAYIQPSDQPVSLKAAMGLMEDCLATEKPIAAGTATTVQMSSSVGGETLGPLATLVSTSSHNRLWRSGGDHTTPKPQGTQVNHDGWRKAIPSGDRKVQPWE